MTKFEVGATIFVDADNANDASKKVQHLLDATGLGVKPVLDVPGLGFTVRAVSSDGLCVTRLPEKGRT